jgi:predicted metal-binding protein
VGQSGTGEIVRRAKRLAKRPGMGKFVALPPRLAAADFAKIPGNSQEETS